MVYFSCNACGQSVKKNQVEKHYQLQCRNCEVLSCVDCGKEFRGDDYQGHTRCISEEEKYGSKDVKPTQSVNKGEVKQDKWIENIQSTIAAAKVPRPIFNLLERLLTFSNIPRKKVKFEKFLQNSLKVYDPRLIGEIWDIVSVVNSDKSGQKDVGLGLRASTQEADTEVGGLQEQLPSKQSKGLDSEDDVKNGQAECEQENCIGKKKKKRKSKTREKAKMETCENCKGEGCANCEENYKTNELEHEQAHVHTIKKKKQKKEASDEENGVKTIFETNEPVEQCTSSEQNHENYELEQEQYFSEAKKKEKHNRKKGTAPDEENTVGELEGKIDVNESNASIEDKHKSNGSGYDGNCSVAKKKKKHKRDKGNDEENGVNVDGSEQRNQRERYTLDCDQTNHVTKKKKKHKRKTASHEEERHSEAQVVLPGDPEMKKRKKYEEPVDDTQTKLQCKVNGSKKKKSKH